MWNTKTKKMEEVDPEKAYHSNIALPDQIKWKDGKPVPIGKIVKLSGIENEIKDGSLKDADYVMTSPAQLFSTASNMVPFLQNNSGNRATYAGKQMEQAIPLKNREAPLVQTVISAKKEGSSLNKFMGQINSQKSSVDGEIVQVKKDGIIIKDKQGKKHEVQIYDNFPLNDDKSFFHSTPLVKVGDEVKSGQTIADTNYTKNGDLALGTNLKAAYIPYKGRNFEDGIVISETAAQKLTSEHMHRKSIDLTKEHVQNKKKFLAYEAANITKEQADKLDDEGVIKSGKKVGPGDTLIASLRKREETDEAKIKARMHKSLVRPYDNVSVKWENDYPGVISNVVKRGKKTEVHVRTEEPSEIGDKLTGRFGEKGIITAIVPDHEMPKTKDGKHIEIALNSGGIPGRLNLGQTLETAAAKIAEKTGKPYVVQNFDGTNDMTEKVQDDLKKHGLSDKEELIDPKTGKIMGKALVGPHYIHKLRHQVGKKLISRAGGPGYAYDMNRIPKGGGPHGAQAMDSLGHYALLAHGANANIREMQTYKSDAENNDRLWSAVQSGDPLPPPRPSFAYNKFISLLKVAGVNTVKDGNSLNLIPITDKQVLEMSNGAIKDSGRMVLAKDLKEEKNGLFDKKLTGGVEGNKWTHIPLPEKMPNPIFEKGILSLTGMTQKEFDSIMQGASAIDPKTGKKTTPDKGISGGPAIEKLLSGINVDKELGSALTLLQRPGLKENRLDKVNKKVKYLRALQSLKATPIEAYMTKNVPVLPPSLRPLSALPDGTLINDDMNGVYKGLGVSVKKFNDASKLLPVEEHNKRRASIYDAMKSVSGLGGHLNREYKGVLDIISGKSASKDSAVKSGSPRESFFQSKLIKRKQDMSMRSTIIPEPELGLDQIGIPRDAAMELYKPFVVREMRGMTGMSPLKAQQSIKKGEIVANKALERVVNNRPLLMKRDPVLHKYGVQAFKPVLTGGKAIKIHPLVTSGFNADFDGDAMSAFVPLSSDAVAEAQKMFPSRNLFSPATGELMYRPTNESQLGIYMMSQKGKDTDRIFKTGAEAAKAVQSGKIDMTDQVTIDGVKTTMGRKMVADVLPENMRGDILSGKITLNGKGQEQILSEVAKKHKNDYGAVADKLKNFGNKFATSQAFSLGLDDLKADKKMRNLILSAAESKVAGIKKSAVSEDVKNKAIVKIYDKASEQMIDTINKTHGKKPTNLYHMMQSGVKPNMEAYRQITMAPMLVMNAKGEIIPNPIKKSWAEGLDIGDYWTQMSGARKGVIQKVQSVQEPGYFTKQMINSTMNNSITTDDCETGKGISLETEEKDVLDRFLATNIKAGKQNFKSGTLITPGVRDSLRNNKVRKVVVRSPLRCEHGTGICGKCYGLDEGGGLPEIGKNVGIISAQAIGERATQLAMRTFHSGGMAPVGKGSRQKAVLADEFNRVQQIVQMQEKIPGSATLSTSTGVVNKIAKDPAGGHNVFVNNIRHYVPQNRGEPLAGPQDKMIKLKPGMKVQKGDPISGGPINPREMLPLTGINKVQRRIASSLYGLYKGEGIRRRNIETAVKSLTNLTRVQNPGDHAEYLRGDFAPTSYVQALNKKLSAQKKKPITHEPVLKGAKTLPLDIQTDWMARLNHEQLVGTVTEAANQGWRSNIHGEHPIPGMAYGAEFGKKKPY
jgi:DNA-directed RNA polymerase subunit beta'